MFQAAKINLGSSLILFEAIQPQTTKLDFIFCVLLFCFTAFKRVGYDNCCIICLQYFKSRNIFPAVWKKFKSKGRECLFIFESSSLWQRQGDHEMIMLLLTFYGYCLKYGLICVGQRLFRNGLWPMLRAELEYDSDLDISLHLILNFFSRGSRGDKFRILGRLSGCIHVSMCHVSCAY